MTSRERLQRVLAKAWAHRELPTGQQDDPGRQADESTNMESTDSIHPNPGRNRKEKEMSAITRATSVAVLFTLGVAVAPWATESPRQVVAASAGHGTGVQR